LAAATTNLTGIRWNTYIIVIVESAECLAALRLDEDRCARCYFADHDVEEIARDVRVL
jgi:hypothetical protein